MNTIFASNLMSALITLNVKFIGMSATRAIEVPDGCTVAELRAAVAREGVFDNFRLVAGGASLKDCDSIAAYGLRDGSTLSAVRVRGAAAPSGEIAAPVIEKPAPPRRALRDAKLCACALTASLDRLIAAGNDLQQWMNSGIAWSVSQSLSDFERANSAEFAEIDRQLRAMRVNKFVREGSEIIDRREKRIVENVLSDDDRELIRKQTAELDGYIGSNSLCSSVRVSLFDALEEE